MTREEILEYARYILYSTPQGFPVKKNDFDYLVNTVFPLHPKWGEFGGSIKQIIVRVNQYGSKHFSVLLLNGGEENISIYDCVYRKGLKDSILIAAKNAATGIELPPLEGRKKKRPEFSAVVKKWIDTIDGGELTVGKYVVPNVSTGEAYFTDPGLANSFINYYRLNG